jgi:hypothetical protein
MVMLATAIYGDREKFACLYPDLEKVLRFATRLKKSPVMKRARNGISAALACQKFLQALLPQTADSSRSTTLLCAFRESSDLRTLESPL